MQINKSTLGIFVSLILTITVRANFAIAEHEHHHAKEEPVLENYNRESLYNSNTEWTNQNGTKIKLGDFKRHPVILTMAYTSCEYSCPIVISMLKNLETFLNKNGLEKVKIVLASFDHERDTPEHLLSYTKRMKLAESRWALLHGSADDILELAVMLGVKFKKDSKGGFSHSNLIALLDSEGRIIARNIGLGGEMKDLISSLKNYKEK